MPRITKVTISGLDKVLKNIPKRDRSVRTSLGIAIANYAKATLKSIKELAPVDSEVMRDAFVAEHPESFKWIIRDINYPAGVIPYAVYHHFGATKHWIHRSQLLISGRFTKNPKILRFLASNRQFIQVGPIFPNPFLRRSVQKTTSVIPSDLKEKLSKSIQV